jgi:hypothetical protein
MFLLPLVGLLGGFVIGDRRALVVPALGAAIGFSLVALLTDEIDGWSDPFVWVDTVVSFVATILGIGSRRWVRARPSGAERPA